MTEDSNDIDHRFFKTKKRTISFYNWLSDSLGSKPKDVLGFEVEVPQQYIPHFRRFMNKFSMARQNHNVVYVSDEKIDELEKKNGCKFATLISDHYLEIGECHEDTEVMFMTNPPITKKVNTEDCKFYIGNALGNWIAFGMCENESKLVVASSTVGVKDQMGYLDHPDILKIKKKDVEQWDGDDLTEIADLVQSRSFEEDNVFYVMPDMVRKKLLNNSLFRRAEMEDVTYVDIVGDWGGWPVRCFYGCSSWEGDMLFGNMEGAGTLYLSERILMTIYDSEFDDENGENRVVLSEKAYFHIHDPTSMAHIVVE